MRGFLYAGLTSVLLLCAQPATAWSPQGHMATGAIAYDDLKASSPALLAEILRLAAALPERGKMDAAVAGLDGDARDRKIFQMLARWPDDVRNGPHDHPAWHYAARAIGGAGGAAVSGQAHQVYALMVGTLRDPAAPAADRASALAWLFHIVGDMHNPVHAAELVSPAFPRGDFHATQHYIRRGSAAMPLHWLWDTASDGPPPDDAATEALVERLKRLPRPARIDDAETALQTWAQESYRLAASAVYPGGRAPGSATQRDAPALDAAYLPNSRRVADERLALAGHRLALLMTALLPGR